MATKRERGNFSRDRLSDVTTASILTTDLNGIASVITNGYTAALDGGAAEWVFTGTTTPGSAGTTDFPNGVLYDANGNQFKYNEPILKVNAFGATGDGVTDDTDAIQDAGLYLATLGSGVLWFEPTGNYAVYPDATNTNPLTSLTNKRGINLAFNGCTITLGRTFTGSQQLQVFRFSGTKEIHIGQVEIVSEEQAIDDTTTRGIFGFVFFKACRNIELETITQTGGIACVWIFRDASTEPTTDRTLGVRASRINTTSVGYSLVTAHSGDDVIANIYSDKAFRSYFPYGVAHHKIRVMSRNHRSDDCSLSAFNIPGESLTDSPFLEDIDLHYSGMPGTVARAGVGPAVTLVAKGPGAVTFRDIDIKYHIVNDATFPDLDIIDVVKHTDSAGTPDTTPARGHVFDNITISGTVIDAPNRSGLLDLWDGAEWVGETIRMFKARDLFITTNVLSTWVMDGGDHENGPTFDNVFFSGQILPGTFPEFATFKNVKTATRDDSFTIDGVQATIASSGGAISLPTKSDFIEITGTLDITSFVANWIGREVTLRFTGTAGTNGIVDGSNIKLAGGADFAYTPDDTLKLVCDGTDWVEISRSVN